MKNILGVIVLFSAFLIVSCDTEKKTDEVIEDVVSGLDTAMFMSNLADIEAKIDTEMPEKKDLQLAITMFTDYAIHFPTDNKSADYMLKASDFSHHLGQNSKAVVLLEKIVSDYPNYDKIESVMYNRAHYLDFELKDTVLAKQYYLEFITTYPNSEFVSSAQARINQHFMSAEELIELWTK
jgi:outer membrane protein assembly factor BamD (BamD/ComL family)